MLSYKAKFISFYSRFNVDQLIWVFVHYSAFTYDIGYRLFVFLLSLGLNLRRLISVLIDKLLLLSCISR